MRSFSTEFMNGSRRKSHDGFSMIATYKLSEENDLHRWDEFVESHPGGTPFHLSGWLKTISQAYGIHPWLFVSEDGKGSIEALVPFFRLKRLLGGYRLVSLPFSDYCGPIGLESSVVHRLLLDLCDNPSLKATCIEIRNHLEEPSGFVARPYYKRHFLRLCPDPQEVLKGIDKRTIQYNIRKARREGVEIVENNTPTGIEEFFRLYILTRKKHGVPHQPIEFFQALARNMIDPGRASVLLAIHKSVVIAAGLFMKHKKTVYYKYNVSDPTYLVKIVPNHLLTWTAIEKACAEGFEALDFGRTAPDNAGLMRYKQMWGAEVHDLPYYYYPASAASSANAESGTIYRLAKRIWGHLPESVVSKLGPMMMKHLG